MSSFLEDGSLEVPSRAWRKWPFPAEDGGRCMYLCQRIQFAKRWRDNKTDSNQLAWVYSLSVSLWRYDTLDLLPYRNASLSVPVPFLHTCIYNKKVQSPALCPLRMKLTQYALPLELFTADTSHMSILMQ